MKHVHRTEIHPDIVREPGAKQVTHRRLIDTPDGADRFVLTEFELAPNGSTPPHFHDWEHEIYVIEGKMGLVLPAEDRTVVVTAGDAVFIPRNEQHGFVSGPDENCRFIVVAPTERPPVRNVFLSDDPYEYTQTPGYAMAEGAS